MSSHDHNIMLPPDHCFLRHCDRHHTPGTLARRRGHQPTPSTAKLGWQFLGWQFSFQDMQALTHARMCTHTHTPHTHTPHLLGVCGRIWLTHSQTGMAILGMVILIPRHASTHACTHACTHTHHTCSVFAGDNGE